MVVRGHRRHTASVFDGSVVKPIIRKYRNTRNPASFRDAGAHTIIGPKNDHLTEQLLEREEAIDKLEFALAQQEIKHSKLKQNIQNLLSEAPNPNGKADGQ